MDRGESASLPIGYARIVADDGTPMPSAITDVGRHAYDRITT
ncbi:hypothetical protein HMPREF9062_0022 [Actinomyces sp. oral taxon 448 str. F0400]|nr:hypothetical protein HMPREF9062_0022 [Actinomyces sp. oral taxon 448 str. F0400]